MPSSSEERHALRPGFRTRPRGGPYQDRLVKPGAGRGSLLRVAPSPVQKKFLKILRRTMHAISTGAQEVLGRGEEGWRWRLEPPEVFQRPRHYGCGAHRIDFLAVVRKEAEVCDWRWWRHWLWYVSSVISKAARGVPRSHLHHDGVGREGVGRPSDKTMKGLVSELDVGAGDQGIIFGYACVRATCLWRTRGQHVWKVCLACARMVFSGGCCQTAVRSKKVAGNSGLER